MRSVVKVRHCLGRGRKEFRVRVAISLALVVTMAALAALGLIFDSLWVRAANSHWTSWPPRMSTGHGRCDKVASPQGSDGNPGTVTAPYRSAQTLAETLAPGQTGCLREGTYRGNGATPLTIDHSGRPGAPIVIRSYPSERARLFGITQIQHGADWILLADLNFEGDGSQNTIKIYSADDAIENSDITNRRRGRSCILLGSPSQGEAVRPLIRGNRLHDCGNPANGNKDHAIYASNTVNGRIEENLITNSSAYALQFYPDAHGMRFDRNLVDGGGDSIRGGVLFGGDAHHASSNNLVVDNVIAFAATYGVTSAWQGPRGRGNVVAKNCFWHARDATIGHAVGFRTNSNLTADPKFRNRRRSDYRMPSNGCCQRVLR
jgi:hypothetical protein